MIFDFHKVSIMRTAALFKNGNNQAVRLPKEFEFEGVTEVEITKEGGSLVLTPKRKSWSSFAQVAPADADFLVERPDIVTNNTKEFERLEELKIEDWATMS